ncbi:TetR/AcrR family transcriptional regulator [soil metagenome]
MPRTARRAQVLESALEVFVAQGYHAAAMDDIADRAGVSKPVLYQHFPGKLDLYLALLDLSCDKIIDACRAALASTEDNKQRVVATMHVFYDYVANAQGAFRLVFESDLTSEPSVRERVDRVTRQCAEAITEVIHEDTGLPHEQSRLLSVSLVGMAQVSARFWLDAGGQVSQDQAAALVAGLAWRGIRGFPRTDDQA